MFLVDFLARLNLLAVYWQPRILAIQEENIQIKISADNLVQISLNTEAGTDQIEFDCSGLKVNIAKALISLNEGMVTVKIPCIDPNMKRESDAIVTKPLGYQDMKEFSRLECRQCANCILDNTNRPITKSVDLPSENWQEFLDCWMCHPDEVQHDNMANVDLSCRKNLIMSGSNYVLVHGSHLVNVEWSDLDAKDPRKWAKLECKGCSNELGSYRLLHHNQNSNGDEYEVKLMKYSLSVARNEISTIRPLFSHCAFYQMFENSRSDANFQFLICSQSTREPLLYLWILNWNSRVIVNGKTNHLQRAARVLYRQPANNDAVSKAERIYYPDVYCEELIKELSTCTLLLPVKMRSTRLAGKQEFRQCFWSELPN